MMSPAKMQVRYLGYRRRAWLLTRLRKADGPTYDVLCAELIASSPALGDYGNAYHIRVHSVRAVRSLLWNELAVTESDETVWLTPLGWADEQLNYAINHADELRKLRQQVTRGKSGSTAPNVTFSALLPVT